MKLLTTFLFLTLLISFGESQPWGDKQAVNINFGGGVIGDRFVPEDMVYVNGNTFSYNNPDAEIIGAEEKNKISLQSHRYGVDGASWTYSLMGLVPGYWDCTLHWAETSEFYFATGKRMFTAILQPPNGKPEGREIDVYGSVGAYTSYTQTWTRISTWDAEFSPISFALDAGFGDPFLSAITCAVSECVDKSGNTVDCAQTANRSEFGYNVGGHSSFGKTVPLPLNYVSGDATSFDSQVDVTGAPPEYAGTLSSHMYGKSWSITIPGVEYGKYTCTAVFAEIYPGNFAVGKRVFSLDVEGLVKWDIDVFARVGANSALVEKFFNVIPSDNKITLKLNSKQGDAMLAAFSCAIMP